MVTIFGVNFMNLATVMLEIYSTVHYNTRLNNKLRTSGIAILFFDIINLNKFTFYRISENTFPYH